MNLRDLYALKGEILTNIEALQAQLRDLDQQILPLFNQVRQAMHKEATNSVSDNGSGKEKLVDTKVPNAPQ